MIYLNQSKLPKRIWRNRKTIKKLTDNLKIQRLLNARKYFMKHL